MSKSIFEMFSISTDHVAECTKIFNAAQHKIADARTFGTEMHIIQAAQEFRAAAEEYVKVMKSHADMTIVYTAHIIRS